MKTEVRKVSHKGLSTTVEWIDETGTPYRSIFPSTELIEENGKIFVEDVEEGQPYGIDWEGFMHTKMGPKGIANLLRRYGIWTLEDYANNSKVVTAAFNEACAANLQYFKESVLRQGKEE